MTSAGGPSGSAGKTSSAPTSEAGSSAAGLEMPDDGCGAMMAASGEPLLASEAGTPDSSGVGRGSMTIFDSAGLALVLVLDFAALPLV
ncbi:MAG: hypothetical protein ACK55I_12960, partial [bacterium]